MPSPRNFEEITPIELETAVDFLLLLLAGKQNSCCCWPPGLLLLLVGRTTTAGVVVLLLVQPRLLLLNLWFDLPSFVLLLQLCAMSSRRTTRPRAATNTAMRGGASRVTPATHSNRISASDGWCWTTGRASAGRSRGSGPTQERENETEMDIEQRLATQEQELGAVMESLATVLGEVSELPAAVDQMRKMLLQITDAINQDPQLAGPAVDGAGSDGRSQREQREEVSLATKELHKAWKQRGTKKHWVVRTCVNIAMVDIYVAELQSALRESVYVTPAIADQMRYMSSCRRTRVCSPRRNLRCFGHDTPSVNGSLRSSSRLLAGRAAPRSE